MMRSLTRTAAALAVSGLVTGWSATRAEAAISVTDPSETMAMKQNMGTVTCFKAGTGTLADCVSYLWKSGIKDNTPGTTSSSSGNAWTTLGVNGSNGNNLSDEADMINKIVGLTGGDAFGAADMNKTAGNSGSMKFMSDYLYALLKVGNKFILVRNDAGMSIDIDWSANNGAGAGLSHYTLAGSIAAVPIPAAGLLLVGALGGLGYMRRRQARKA